VQEFSNSSLPQSHSRLAARVTETCIRWRWLAVTAAIVLLVLSSAYVGTHFAINTDTARLISSDVPWRQREIALDTAFTERTDLTVIVIDADIPEQAEKAGAALAERLEKLPTIRSVRRPASGPFFEKNGLLFLSPAEIARNTEQLIKAQPFLGSLAADPSLRGVMNTLSLMTTGVEQGEATLDSLATALAKMADGFEGVVAGTPVHFSWRELISGEAPAKRELRRVVLVQPVLDFGSLEPGRAASDAIRAAARDLDLTPANGVRIRLTGPVPLADDEFATVADGALINGVITIILVTIILWLALKSLKIVLAVAASLAVGLSIAAAAGLMMVHAFNVISIAFFVLFIGLGVDFGLQYSVLYRERRHLEPDLKRALLSAADAAGRPLALAAAAVTLGFYSFLPTDYRGLSELGLIAGSGMIVAFLTSITLLPALLSILDPPSEPAGVGYKFMAPVDRFLADHRRAILIGTALVSLGGLPLLAWLQFDFNPMHLRSSKVESVSTFIDLARDPDTDPNTIDVLRPSLAEASALAGRLEKLPEVDKALTLLSFVPEDQEQKLPLIEDAATLLSPTLDPPSVEPPPSDAEIASAMESAAHDLGSVAGNARGSGADAARRLSKALATISRGSADLRDRAGRAILSSLSVVLDQTRAALNAGPVTTADLPADLVRDWVAPNGAARVEVSPKGDSNDNATLLRFVSAVETIAPDAIGAPVAIQESGRTVVTAFIHAGIWALVSTSFLLIIVLRRITDVLLTLVPLILAGVVALEICSLLDFPLNFANIIALPVLLGVGVAFKIYFVMAWRAGKTDLLQSSLTRAVFFSGLTTATGFGSLWLSNHPGTSSMGRLLALSLVCTMVAAVLFQPVLMGPPRKSG
jgi:hopanoid biosynthesis associated RND transporter like protein HpnN